MNICLKPINNRTLRCRGAILIEAILGILICSLLAVSLIELLMMSSQINRSNKGYTIASQIARAEIENIRSTKACLLSNCTDASPTGSYPSLTSLPGGVVKLTINDSSLLTGGKDVTVTVTWKYPATNKTQTLSLKTMVSPDGPTS
jgi:hypothetical protein